MLVLLCRGRFILQGGDLMAYEVYLDDFISFLESKGVNTSEITFVESENETDFVSVKSDECSLYEFQQSLEKTSRPLNWPASFFIL